MITKAFAVFDVKAGNYGSPIFCLSEGIALRSFVDVTNDGQSAINKHPADYSLFEIGSYDDSSAELICKKPRQVVQATSVYVEPKTSVAQPTFPGMQAMSGAPVAATKEMMNGETK